MLASYQLVTTYFWIATSITATESYLPALLPPHPWKEPVDWLMSNFATPYFWATTLFSFCSSNKILRKCQDPWQNVQIFSNLHHGWLWTFCIPSCVSTSGVGDLFDLSRHRVDLEGGNWFYWYFQIDCFECFGKRASKCRVIASFPFYASFKIVISSAEIPPSIQMKQTLHIFITEDLGS